MRSIPNKFEVPCIISQAERTGRRSYKMMRLLERESSWNSPRAWREAVWPPRCEEALLEGLRAYRPVSKTGRPLRRFTKRNVFISTYIFQKTGKTRTPKQVGSRLQQISESSRDENLKMLITNRHFSPERVETQLRPDILPCAGSSPKVITSPSGYSCSISCTIPDIGSPQIIAPTELFNTELKYQNLFPVESVSILVELLASEAPEGLTTILGLNADITERGIDLILSLELNRIPVDHGFYNARRLPSIPIQPFLYQPPQLNIVSSYFSYHTAYICTFGVYLDGKTLIHSEDVPLTVTKAPNELYSEPSVWCAPILSGYWDKISRNPGMGRYTIMLDIAEIPVHPSGFSNLKPEFSVALKFQATSLNNMSCTEFYPSGVFTDEPSFLSTFPSPLPLEITTTSSDTTHAPYYMIL